MNLIPDERKTTPTDVGFVYVAINDSMPDLVKIGMTCGSVQERMKELSAATGVAKPFSCPYFCEVQNPQKIEEQLHNQFSFCRENERREFFRTDWRAIKAALEMMQKADGAVISATETKPTAPVGKFSLIKWVKEGNADNVRKVLSMGGKADQTDSNGKSALIQAIELGDDEIVNILLAGGADPNKMNKEKNTPLYIAAINNYAVMVKSLLDYGADMNTVIHAVDNKGRTALHVAAEKEHAEIVKLLLKGGANVNAVDNNGRTALDDSYYFGQIFYILIEHGANNNIRPPTPPTP